MFGVLNINKPRGMTSHDVVGVLRKILNTKQIGHTGTLDPFAEGVLPICIGKATRLIEYFDNNKEYLATVQFGSSTDTYDLEGKVLKTSSKKVKSEEIESALKDFEGEIEQTPPIYSAIKLGGKKLYEYARKGETVTVPKRKVTIYNIKLINFDETNQQAEILISCSQGTYIRSIANDLGENLGCYAHLIKLVRTQSGKFRIETAINLDDENIKDKIQNPLSVISLEKITVDEAQHKRISHGMPVRIDGKELKSGEFLILVYNNSIDAIGVYNDGEIKVKKVFI